MTILLGGAIALAGLAIILGVALSSWARAGARRVARDEEGGPMTSKFPEISLPIHPPISTLPQVHFPRTQFPLPTTSIRSGSAVASPSHDPFAREEQEESGEPINWIKAAQILRTPTPSDESVVERKAEGSHANRRLSWLLSQIQHEYHGQF